MNEIDINEKYSHILVCNQYEYDIIKDCVETFYINCLKYPHRYRTEKFYLLEEVYKSKF